MSYAEFFLRTASSVVELETIEISHPNFSSVYRCVRNAKRGIVATLEDGSSAEFTYYPLQIKQKGAQDDLDYGISITFGDLGEILPFELDRVYAASGFGTKPVVIYRTYRSDNLASPMSVIKLEVKTFAFNKTGATFDAAAPSLNVTSTGEIYTVDRFPMLRGLL